MGNDYHESGQAMGDVIALSSPSGRMSKRALKAAQDRISAKLFPPGYWESVRPAFPPQPTKREALLRQAARLRDLASRGMKPRAFAKEAARLEAEVALLGDEE